MIEKLDSILKEAISEIDSCSNVQEVNNAKSKYMGKKSAFTEIMAGMGSLSPEEKKNVGQKSNEVRNSINEALEKKLKDIKDSELNAKLESDKIDLTLPSKKKKRGSKHPLTMVREEIEDLFISMGYDVVSGPEVETVENCFDMLNAPKSHPSRDPEDTFYIDDEIILRTQTSTMQVRSMLANTEKKPFKLICDNSITSLVSS